MSDWRKNPKAGPYIKIIELAAKENDLDADLLGNLIQRESQFDPSAESDAGAQGIAQIVSKWHPGVDVADPVASIREAAKYLKANEKRFGDMPRALAAYNHGPTAVRSYGAKWREMIPDETEDYVNALSPPPSPDDLIKALRGK